eukprot:1038037_1
MSNSRRPISAHFARLSLNQKTKFIAGHNTNTNTQKPSTAHSKYRNIWGLNGNKIRTNPGSDFSPTIKVTSLQPNRKPKPNRQNRPRPQTSNGVSSRRNARSHNHTSNAIHESESNSRLLTYHHHNTHSGGLSLHSHSLKTQNKENKYRKNYNKNAKHSYSSTSIGSRYGITNNQKNKGMVIRSAHTSRINSDREKDSVIFAIDPKYPLCPIVFRDEKAKTISRERLNLDNRNLSQCPILRGEENLRLLNYENNIISKISNLNNLKNLIFLDLYNNRIAKIENLHFIPMLRVLMLGRNEISKIENLDTLHCLDVLDLHSNKITKMQNLNHLHELRVLNLAGNEISNIENIHNLKNLVELNLRRNVIYKMESFITHQKLQRILLSNNNIRNIKNIVPLSFAKCIQQLTLDNNPFYDKFHHKTQNTDPIYSHPYHIKIISMFKSLKQLNDFEITDSIKQKVSLNESGFVRLDDVQSVGNSPLLSAIASQSSLKTNESTNNEAKEAIAVEEDALLAQNNDLKDNTSPLDSADTSDDIIDTIQTTQAQMTEDELISKIKEEWTLQSQCNKESDRLRHFQLDSNDKILKMYGCGVPKMDNDRLKHIEQLHFYYVDFNELTKYFNYLKTLKTVQLLSFDHNKIHSLYQIDALSVVSHIKNVSFGDNEITKTSSDLYRLYCVFRLPNVQCIDGKKVTANEKEMAKKHFGLLRNQWKNSKILLTRGFCAPNLNQIRNINEKDETFYKSNIHEIFNNGTNDCNGSDQQDMDTDEMSEFIQYQNKAKQSIQHAINIYKARQKIKAMWPVIVSDCIQQVINDLQATST